MSEKVPELLQEVYEHPEKYAYYVETGTLDDLDSMELLYKGQKEIVSKRNGDKAIRVGSNECDTLKSRFIIRVFLKERTEDNNVSLKALANIPYTFEINTPNGFHDILGVSETLTYQDGVLEDSNYLTSDEDDIARYLESDKRTIAIPAPREFNKYYAENFTISREDRSWNEQATVKEHILFKYDFSGPQLLNLPYEKQYHDEYSNNELYELIKDSIINGYYINYDPEGEGPNVDKSDRFKVVEKGDTILVNYHYETEEESPTVYEKQYPGGPITKTSIDRTIKDMTWVVKLLPVPGTFVTYQMSCVNDRNIYVTTVTSLTDRQNELIGEADAYHETLLSYLDKFTNITPKVTYGDPVYYEISKPSEDQQHVVIDKNASEEIHHKDKTTINPGIIVGFGALLVAGVGAALYSKNKKDKNIQEEVSYQLVVDKNFGNRIRKGSKLDEVTAWIEKRASDGETYLRSDLSSNISFKPGKYIEVSEAYDVKGRAATRVYVDKSVADDVKEDFISIIYSGEGGSFTERLHFKIVGDPYITYPDMEKTAMMMNVFAIAGDKANYKVIFKIEDADREPIDIKIVSEDPRVKLDYKKLEDFIYEISIENNTEAIKDIVYDIEERINIEVKVMFRDVDIRSGFNFCLVPEGLSIKGSSKDGKLLLRSYENEGAGATDPKINPTEFRPVLAISEDYDDGQRRAYLVDIDETEVEAYKLKEENDLSHTILEKYEYEIDTERRSVIAFIPQRHLPAYYPPHDWEKQEAQDYPVSLPLTVSFEGKDYSTNIPCMLVGEKLRPMDVRKEEYLRVVSMITRYVPYENQDEMFEKLNYLMKYRSVSELRVIEKKLLADAIEFYSKEASDYIQLEKDLAWWQDQVEWIKAINDAAFSIVIARMTSDVAEIFITPAKDVLLEALGALSVEYFQGEPFDIDKLPIFDNLAKVGENLISSELDIYNGFTADKNTWKKALAVVGGYMAYMALKNYLETLNKKKPDLIGSILKTFSDLTNTVVKGYILGSMKKYVTTDAFKNKMNGIFDKYIKETFFEQYLKGALETIVDSKTYDDTSQNAQKFLQECYDKNGKFLESRLALWSASVTDENLISGWDLLQKFLDEQLGAGIAFVQKGVGQPIASKKDHLQIKSPLSEDVLVDLDFTKFCSSVTDGISDGANYVINLIYGDVPSEKDKKEYPEDIPVSME